MRSLFGNKSSKVSPLNFTNFEISEQNDDQQFILENSENHSDPHQNNHNLDYQRKCGRRNSFNHHKRFQLKCKPDQFVLIRSSPCCQTQETDLDHNITGKLKNGDVIDVVWGRLQTADSSKDGSLDNEEIDAPKKSDNSYSQFSFPTLPSPLPAFSSSTTNSPTASKATTELVEEFFILTGDHSGFVPMDPSPGFVDWIPLDDDDMNNEIGSELKKEGEGGGHHFFPSRSKPSTSNESGGEEKNKKGRFFNWYPWNWGWSSQKKESAYSLPN